MRVNRREIEKLVKSEMVERALRECADAGAEGARRRAPVDTGRLRDSIDSDSEPGKAVYSADTPYALDQEFGTKYQPGTPFLRPALDDAKGPL